MVGTCLNSGSWAACIAVAWCLACGADEGSGGASTTGAVSGGDPSGTAASTGSDDDDDAPDDDGAPGDDEGDGSSGSGEDTADSGDPGTGDSGGADDGPSFLVFAADKQLVTAEDSVTFTAVVTDPDGVDDIIGGTLSTATGTVCGPFVTAAQEGSYGLQLPWEDITAAAQSTYVCAAEHEFVAEFFDQAGHSVTDSLTITLSCEGASGGFAIDDCAVVDGERKVCTEDSYFYCSTADPQDWADNGACDCPGCPWDAADCGEAWPAGGCGY